ncbi:Os01g0214901, partial [Oryza sativa Japonica Group]
MNRDRRNRSLHSDHGGLHVLEPLDLGVQRAGVPHRVPQPAPLEVRRVQRRRAGDGEVGAAVERRVLRLRRRQQRQPHLRTDEVDDEAAVGATPGGVPEVRHPVRQPRRGEVVRDAIHDEVAGVHQRVPEVEDGRVLLRHRHPRRPERR